MELVLITFSFLVALILVGKSWPKVGLLFLLFLITSLFTIRFHEENKKEWTVTVKAESFRAKNVSRKNGVIRGVRIDDGREFVVVGEIK